MENRKDELYSQVVPAGKRRYFFDVKATRRGDKYITITESRRVFDNRTGDFSYEKNKIFLYKEDYEKFQKGLANAVSFLETGIEPEPLVFEDKFHGLDDVDANGHHDQLDDIDFNF